MKNKNKKQITGGIFFKITSIGAYKPWHLPVLSNDGVI